MSQLFSLDWISNRIKQEEATFRQRLKVRDAKYRELFDSITDAIVMHDSTDLRPTDVNSSLVRILGYSRSELLKPETVKLLAYGKAPYTAEQIHNNLQRAICDRSFVAEFLLRDCLGNLVWVEGHSKLLQHHGQSKILTTVKDISDRKEREVRQADLLEERLRLEKIALSNYQFGLLISAIPHLMWVANPQGRIVFYNDRFTEVTGLSLQQEDDQAWQLLIHPDDLGAYLSEWNMCVQTGNSFEREFRLTRVLGLRVKRTHPWRRYLAKAVAMRQEDGHITQWVGTWTDT
jgi:PAS domain S-box-containing protein